MLGVAGRMYIKNFLIAGLAILSLIWPGSAGAQSATPFTQRRINEVAAALERARRALLEDTRLRRPGERLPDYLHRIAAPFGLDRFASGRLIDEVGLKGFRHGDAQISHIHANIMVNLGNATAKNVREILRSSNSSRSF